MFGSGLPRKLPRPGGPRNLMILAGVLVLGLFAFAVSRPKPAGSVDRPASSQPTVQGSGKAQPLVFTYLFYWYDAKTNYHLGPNQPLPTHPVPVPESSWRSIDWFKQQLSDMASAGIDVVLPVYWGFEKEQWSTEGLEYLVKARDELTAAGKPSPAVGLFFDTTILAHRDLTQADNMAFFYANVKDFYSRIPSREWGRVQARPVVWLYQPQVGNNFDQHLFDYVYDHFTQDFGVRPFIVREGGWYCAIPGWDGPEPRRDCSKPVQTDGEYAWGAAFGGYKDFGNVASVGPGYDERLIPARAGHYRPRDNGAWYRANFERAIASRKRMLAIETWNEFHEATGISDSVEYGRTYIELTRALVQRYRDSFPAPS